jgi:hypothetical protein
MSKTQNFPISDKPTPEVIQRNLEDLYEFAHSHSVRTSVPTEKEGSVGDIIPVLLNGTDYLYVKLPAGWKRTVLS